MENIAGRTKRCNPYRMTWFKPSSRSSAVAVNARRHLFSSRVYWREVVVVTRCGEANFYSEGFCYPCWHYRKPELTRRPLLRKLRSAIQHYPVQICSADRQLLSAKLRRLYAQS
jgi:hypothetical protein